MLSYNDIGKGTPIIFIHGLGSRKEAWRFQNELSENYRLIMVDLRGHGETEIDGEISMHTYAKDVIKLLEYLNIDGAFMCGLSLGGLVVQEIHKQKPDLIYGLILADTTTYIPHIADMIVNGYKDMDKDSIMEAIVNRSLFKKELENEFRESFLIKDTYLSCAKAPIGVDYTCELLKICKPMLFICGIHDKVTPVFQSFLMYMMTFNSKFVTLNTGHLSNLEDPKGFNRSIDNFIKEVVI